MSHTDGLGRFGEMKNLLALKGIEPPFPLPRPPEINPYTDCGRPAQLFLAALCTENTVRLNSLKMYFRYFLNHCTI